MTVIKCVVVGDSETGKSTSIISYIENKFNPQVTPTVFNYYPKNVTMEGVPYILVLSDTAGLEDYDNLRRLCYPKTDVLLVCFSVVSPTSFENVQQKWIPEITRHCPKTPFLLVGTKIDLREDAKTIGELAENNQKPVTFFEGENLAKELKVVKYVECSASTGEGLKNVFDEAMLAALESPKPVKKGKCNIL